MCDDIIERLRTAPPSMLGVRLEAADLIEAQQAEIERLRIERDDLQVLLKGRTAEFQAEITRLRAERDCAQIQAAHLAQRLVTEARLHGGPP